MPIRLSGLTSGLDTEAIVGALVSAYSFKKDKYTKAQTKLTWKQDAWKSLNTKVYNLYTSVGNMRYSSNYSAKKTTVSDTSKATATASGQAINGTQTLEIKQLAKTAYITGGYIEAAATGDATLSSLGAVSGTSEKASIQVRTSTGTKNIEVDGSTKIDQLISKFNEAGVQANFDEKNHRFFISAQTSGAEGNFEISANNTAGLSTLITLGLLSDKEIDSIKGETAGSEMSQRTYTYKDGAKSITYYAEGFAGLVSNLKTAKDTVKNYNADDYAAPEDPSTETEEQAAAREAAGEAAARAYETANELLNTYADFVTDLETNHGVDWDTITADEITALGKTLYDAGSYDSRAQSATEDEINTAVNAIRDAYVNLGKATTDTDIAEAQAALNKVLADSNNKKWADYIEANFGSKNSETDESYSNFWTQSDNKELVDSVFYRVDLASNVAVNNQALEIDDSLKAKKIDGQDAKIILNEVEYTNNTNSITVNGLTIEAMAETTQAINVTVQNDTDALYDKIKDFLTSYNNLVNEMQKLYNADSAKDYEPLTDDEKSQMNETEIEKWEQKIKDSLLRRDTTLSGLISTMTTSMLKTYEVNGKKVALSTYGIVTLGTLKAEKNENYAYHINGDSEDSYTSGAEDKLRAAIAANPDEVIDFMKALTSDLYSNLDKKMKSTAVKSVYTVYNDKEMASEYSNYSSLIKQWTDRIKDQEDAYYKKFSKMESALAKLQNNSSSLTSMLGG
ncbi:flagellar filament capping protein FliD [Pseudobutyrivibrio xylanivorans]|uniref:Flagellar hook-associated protein 2 n=1 Tax=Pseudobutyrivibrio xylanivorans TaxID=185007 RepID=A0A5P6VT26_PSEXY|nr:flagellar filament capping protein FliD [Pseudobutyrivibrio xylanivorans]QFJ54011.1 hypothetical protein FXF36_03550 [Pseudobutyrivibrio xylanivorans]